MRKKFKKKNNTRLSRLSNYQFIKLSNYNLFSSITLNEPSKRITT